MRFLALSALLAASLLLPLERADAQAPAPTTLRATPVQLAAFAAIQPEASIPDERPALLARDPYQHGTRQEGGVLMLVGAAGIVAGLLLDEPVVTILGAGVGGLGLYFYLR